MTALSERLLNCPISPSVPKRMAAVPLRSEHAACSRVTSGKARFERQSSSIKISNPRDRNFHLGPPRGPVENEENATFAFCVPVHTSLAGAGLVGADGSRPPSQDCRSLVGYQIRAKRVR